MAQTPLAASVPPDPHRKLIPQTTLGECRSELDERLEEIEEEIKALMEFWERSFVDDNKETDPEIPWISKWHLEHPLDLNDEFLREDPGYNEEQVEQEAVQDYLKELGEQRYREACEQAASQKPDTATVGGLPGRPTTSARALAGLSEGRPPTHKKPYAILRRLSIAGREEAQEESGSPSSSSEEEEVMIPPKKMSKRNFPQSRTTGRGKTHTGNPADRHGPPQQCKLSREAVARQKVLGPHRRNHLKPVTDQASENSETPSSTGVEGQSSTFYNFRRRSKVVSYVSEEEEEEEEEEKSWSEGSSEQDWLPEEQGCGDEEEEEPEGTEEEEDEETDVDEESEGDDGRPARPESQRKTLQRTARSYRCPECGQEFSNSSNMWKHMVIHTGEHPYGCHVCGKSYKDLSTLTKHQQRHTGERLHQCPTCPKSFYLKGELSIHIRKHQGIRPFACMECGSSFDSNINLLYHMKIHVEGKGSHRNRPPVRCVDCDRTFDNSKQLRRHQKRHKVCEDCGKVFTDKSRLKFHQLFHSSHICAECGLTYVGVHFCQRPARKAEETERAGLKPSASVPQGVVADRLLSMAAHAKGLKQLVFPTQAVTRSLGTDQPSVAASSLLPAAGHVRPSTLAHATCLKALSSLAKTTIGTLQQSRPRAPATPLVLDERTAKPSNPTQTPLQLTPGGFLQNAPVSWLVTPSLTAPTPSTQTPALPKPVGPLALQPHSQAPVTLPISTAAPPTMVPHPDLHPKPVTVTIPLLLTPPLGSNPVIGAENGGLILIQPQTLPPGTKIILEIPCQTIVPAQAAQVCAICQTKYMGTHSCTKLPQDPARRGGEKTCRSQLESEEKNIVGPQQPSPIHPPRPQVQDKQEPLAKSDTFHQADSQVTDAQHDGEEIESVSDGDCEVLLSKEEASDTEEVLPSVASKPLHWLLGNQRELRQSKPRKSRYVCNICDKRFVYQRSLRQHRRLHLAFSCDQCDASFLRSEQLKRHKLCHVQETTVGES